MCSRSYSGARPPAAIAPLSQQASQRASVQTELILHRDLKPAIMLLALDESARVVLRLADFGSAVKIFFSGAASLSDEVVPTSSREASAGNIHELTTRICLVPYAAPEILLGSTKRAPQR